MILGGAHPRVVEAVCRTARSGTSFGAPCVQEVELAEAVCQAFPSIEVVRMVNSGTEAAMSALRLVRAFTGRNRIVKFEGCYHGHVDSLLVRAGSGAMTLGLPDCAGVPQDVARHTHVAPFNDEQALRNVLDAHSSDVAAVLIEPIPAYMGVVKPRKGFLKFVRELTAARGILLIFDEVITGFRVALGGVQEVEGVRPDLTLLGKVIGGGLPVGAYGGPREIMQQVAPLGPVYQAGTLSGNPLAMAAGLETLRVIREDPGFYHDLERKSKILADSFESAAREAGVPATVSRVGSMMTVFFCEGAVESYADARRADTERYAMFFRGLLNEGIALAPSQFEAAFVSAAHQEEHLQQAAVAAGRVMKILAQSQGARRS